MAKTQPNQPSSAYEAMRPYWDMVDDIMGGAETMRRVTGGVNAYLYRFEKEDQQEYEYRVQTAPYTPLYADAFRNLASKPFSREVAISEDAPESISALIENIDGAGNHLHVFARDVFKAGINYGVDWIWVGHTSVPAGATEADRKAMNARPFWLRIPAKRMLAVYEDTVDGELAFVHVRIDESYVVRDGYDEVVVERVRVIDRPMLEGGGYGLPIYQVFEFKTNADRRRRGAWELVDEGSISLGIIPLVAFVTGERESGEWVIRPPLRDLAYMQITEFQMESNRERVQTMTAFPVGVFQGVAKPEEKDANGRDVAIPMGPRTQFWLPPIGDGGQYGDFKFVEPSGSAGEMLRKDIEEFRREMREMGMQPLTPNSGNLTATATAVAEAKAHSAVEMWALALQDALDLAMVYTARWLGLSDDQAPSVIVHTDFSVGQQSVEEMRLLLDMEKEEIISEDQLVAEAQRRNILGPNYDREYDLERILAQIPADDPDEQAAMVPPEPQPEEDLEPEAAS